MHSEAQRYFLKPNAFERAIGRLFGLALRVGLGFSHNYALEVRGRKTGRVFSTPVNLLVRNGKRYLVASRGETSWVRNARAAGKVALVKGSRREEFAVREVPAQDRPELLKEFVDRFALTVQRYYPVPKGSPASAFAEIAARYPVFELIPGQDRRDAGARA